MIDKKTKIQRYVEFMISDMIEGCVIDPDEDFSDEARSLGVTAEEIVQELRRQAKIFYTRSMSDGSWLP